MRASERALGTALSNVGRIVKGALIFHFPEDFSGEIDLEARRLLQILPAYDPGAGHVSAECKRHSDIFHEELAKFTLWALRSK